MQPSKLIGLWTFALCVVYSRLEAEPSPTLRLPEILTNREVRLRFDAPAGRLLQLESSFDLSRWSPLSTLLSAPSATFTDSAAPFAGSRFYRVDFAPTNAIVGDYVSTTNGPAVIHPIEHATFVMTWEGKTIYSDPVGATSDFAGLPRADLILVTHGHGDHFNAGIISAVRGSNAVLLVPQIVYSSLPANLKAIATVMANGGSTNLLGLTVDAVPAYNLTSNNHPKGQGNGYVLTMAGARIYISGDTEDIPEMRSLSEIDIAFVCMNLPFTMSVDKAADAVRAFQPRVVYPYHYRGSDVNRFKQLVGADREIEVRLRAWY